MVNSVLAGTLSVTALFLGGMDDVTPMVEHGKIESTYNLSQQMNQGGTLEVLDGTESLLYMKPAKQQSEKLKKIRDSVQSELEERALTKATEEKALQLEKENDRITTEWKNNFPKYNESTPQGKFINQIAEDSVRIAYENDIYPSVMIAQAGHESNWGRSGLATKYNNLMGTKGSWKGKSATMRTGEHVNGQQIYINAGFSVYDSWAESLERYGGLIRNGISSNSTFYSGAWRSNAESYKDATSWLQGRYATDTNYASKVNQTIESYNLDEFDNIKPLSKELEQVSVDVEVEPVNIHAPDGVYEVRHGDSLFGIAVMHDLPVHDLIRMNKLESPLLEVGQWLILHENTEVRTVEDLLDEKLVTIEPTDGFVELSEEALEKFKAN